MRNDRKSLEELLSEIRSVKRRSYQDTIEIGKILIEVKARLKHGQFGAWLEEEFGWAERTAQRWMAMAKDGGDAIDHSQV